MPPEPRTAGKPALRQRIGRHVLLSLLLIWALGSAVVLVVGSHFVAEAFDRALLDDAHALALHVRGGPDGALHLDLTPREADLLRFDQHESVRFAVWSDTGALLGGDEALPGGTSSGIKGGDHRYRFSDTVVEGREMRRTTLRIEGPPGYTVVMAETTSQRAQLLGRLLLFSVLAQLWLLVVLGSWLLRGIERDLRPLADLQDAMARRDAADLQPLPGALTTGARTSDVERLGEALDGLLARVRRGLQAQREFAGNVAHELRTPLAGIRAQAGNALAQDDPAIWRSELQGIADAEQRASRTVDQLLALARAAEGEIALPLQTVALDALVRRVLLRYLPRADALGVDLGAEGLDAPVAVRGDAGLIEGILNNLLDNALRYGRGEPPRITVMLEQAPPWAVLRVADNGPGTGEGLDGGDDTPMVRRWIQGEQGRRLGHGAGLGLAIVGRYAELMKGRVWMEESPGGGVTACVHLPLAEMEPDQNAPGIRPPSVAS